MIRADASILQRNLAALGVRSPGVAERLRALGSEAAGGDARFIATPEGPPSAVLGEGPSERALASRRRPLDEGRAIVAGLDVAGAGVFVTCGFGLGYHALALAERLGKAGLVLVYEPDLRLLRGVLERVDHSVWLTRTHASFIDRADDAAGVASALHGMEGLVALGVRYVDHPAQAPRLGPTADTFRQTLAGVVRAVRTNVLTTLVQCDVTIRNELMNLDRYALCPGVAELAGAAGEAPGPRAGIVVSAGPSLRRNLHLLTDPRVRERCVIVAVQTVLGTLLRAGVRPHFVTALDHHEISARFYEGLSPADVEGVTLVAEPKSNPAILTAFPGAARLPSSRFLDLLLEGSLPPDRLGPSRGTLRSGATVAHLAYELARHLGCDPVILVGQDLAFTDGQYYAAGAAIHRVWSGELSAFNTLETMEWQRIARMRAHLHRAIDVLGRPVYTDEQMATYRVQFERDFAADAARGLTTLDASEGGVRKQHAEPLALREALDRFVLARPPMPPLPPARPASDPGERLARVRRRVDDVRASVARVGGASRRAADILKEMLEHHADQARVNALIERVHAVRAGVMEERPAFELVQLINQTGVLKRARADRELSLDPDVTPLERQRRQIERDEENVRWTGDAADELGALLDRASGCLAGAPKLTRDPAPPASRLPADASPARVIACIDLDESFGGLGTRRALDEPLLRGRTPLGLTVERLRRTRGLAAIAVLAPDRARAEALLGPGGDDPRVRIIPTPASIDAPARRAGLRGGRLWSRDCWRAGPGGMSVYDEPLHAPRLLAAMDALGATAALPVGADWALIDPALVDAVIERHLERPAQHRLTFAQAAPGLGACLLSRSLVDELARAWEQGGALASVGALLGYLPVAPMLDPIASPRCVVPDPLVRDLGVRVIPDTPSDRARLLRAFAGVDPDALDAAGIARALRDEQAREPADPTLRTLRLGRADDPSRPGDADELRRAIDAHAGSGGVGITLGAGPLWFGPADGSARAMGYDDALTHPAWPALVAHARGAGLEGVHLRTRLSLDEPDAAALADLAPTRRPEHAVDVLSVDLLAESPETYRAITGRDELARCVAATRALLDARARRSTGGLRTPWVVARLTRRDAVYEQVERFYDGWLLAAGACVIDPLPAPIPGERIEPLPVPEPAARRLQHAGAPPAPAPGVLVEPRPAPAHADGAPA